MTRLCFLKITMSLQSKVAGGGMFDYDAPILRSPSVSRIRYVSDTDTAGIRLGYVSGDFYYFRILLCIGYAYGYVWATLDTAQHIFWPIQPTNRYNPNSLRPPTLPVSHEQQPPGVRGALLPHPPGAICDATRRRGRRRPRATPPTRRPPVLLPHGLSSASAVPPTAACIGGRHSPSRQAPAQ